MRTLSAVWLVACVAALVLVSAVGNSWPPSTRGSDADGGYALCADADPCDQTGGTGSNVEGAGAGARLRLAAGGSSP